MPREQGYAGAATFDGATAGTARLDIKDTFQSLRPAPAPDLFRGHGARQGLVLRLINCFGLVAFAPLGGRY